MLKLVETSFFSEHVVRSKSLFLQYIHANYNDDGDRDDNVNNNNH